MRGLNRHPGRCMTGNCDNNHYGIEEGMSAYPSASSTSKGARYLAELDQALCNGEWSKIPELARKTEKHASQRRCFTTTARTEAQIALNTSRATSTTSPALSNSNELVASLKEGIAKEQKQTDDVYAANICLAETHWLQEDYDAVLKVLSQDSVASSSVSNRAVALGWLEVCEVKAELFRIEAIDRLGNTDDDVRARCLAVAKRTPGSRTPELRRWTERLLGRICLAMVPRTATPTLEELSQSIRCFAAWADFWQRSSNSAVSSATNTANGGIPRRTVWKAYYDLVSVILQHGLMYNPSPKSTSDLVITAPDDMSAEQYLTAKVRQRSAMRKVEMAYESLLLQETQFPKASQTNTEVEEWVQQVITNWKILTGPTWTDAELGTDGKEILSRGVLDILYRAASKTFHSTAILRYLFAVHAALGEFDLAMHSFNSYVEIISKEKARAEKTGSYNPGMDSADTAVITAAEAVRFLCRYGDREQGERAIEVGKIIKAWVNEEHNSSTENGTLNGNGSTEEAGPSTTHEHSFQPKTLAVAYRAIGIAQAHWARLTYDTESRSSIQTEALSNLRIAQKHDEDNIETAYALGLLLAESRNVPAAAKVLKHVFLTSSSNNDEDDESEAAEDYGRKRMLIPIWHLLGLCSTAKDEYEQGAKMCEAAFEQFGDESVLFGDARTRLSGDDEKLPPQRPKGGLVDLMDGVEKESLLQIRMSQLTFVELMEGAEAALDTSHELLALYARLFGNPELSQPPVQKPPATATSTQPSKLGGTLRSIAGSIRPKSARQSGEKDPRITSTVSLPTREKTEPDTAANGETFGVPIAITVTNEDGVRTEKSHHHRHLAFMRRGFYNESHSSLRKKRSFRNEDRPSTPVQISRIPENSVINTETPLSQSTVEQSNSTDDSASPEQPLKEMEHNEQHDKWPPPPGHDEQPPRQDVRLPAPDPASNLMPNAKLPSARDRQQKLSLLFKIWLFIGGLYLRSELFDDAGCAINEATQLVESFEAEVASEHSSARRFYEKGWGAGESVDTLWADVFSARGYLAVAREQPFDAISHFEQALAHFPDHADAIIGLAKLLMDIYEEKLPAEEPKPLLSSQPSPSSSSASAAIPPAPQPPMHRKPSSSPSDSEKIAPAATDKAPKRDLTPPELNRLAARDRAYMLLSNLTRLGNGWDNSEAWYTLARAYELSKQVGKAKQALWWVVELEESEPMRPWREVAAGGFTL